MSMCIFGPQLLLLAQWCFETFTASWLLFTNPLENSSDVPRNTFQVYTYNSSKCCVTYGSSCGDSQIGFPICCVKPPCPVPTLRQYFRITKLISWLFNRYALPLSFIASCWSCESLSPTGIELGATALVAHRPAASGKGEFDKLIVCWGRSTTNTHGATPALLLVALIFVTGFWSWLPTLLWIF